MSSFDEHHLLDKEPSCRLKFVEIHPARHHTRIPCNRIEPGFLLLVHQHGDLPAKQIVHLQTHQRETRNPILDHRCWIEGIWVILFEREIARSICSTFVENGCGSSRCYSSKNGTAAAKDPRSVCNTTYCIESVRGHLVANPCCATVGSLDDCSEQTNGPASL